VFVGRIWFYLTPVIYPLTIVPEKYENWLVALNPMTALIEGWRDLFLGNQIPGLDMLPALAFAAGFAALGSFSFRQLQGGFADAL
jgi:lipopolysaccharide transport system permease protein